MFGKLGINKKLALALWGSALTAFAVAGLGLAIFQDLTLERRAMQAMEPYARLVSVGAEGAVAFQDPVRAQEVLDTLRSKPEIRGAAIILDDGRVLAGFGIKSGAKPFIPSDKSYAISLSHDKAELRQALPHGAFLRLVMGLGGLKDDTRQIMWLLGAGGLVLLAVTFGQLAVLRRAIIRPVTDLAATAEVVRTRADYDRQVPAAGNDEVAQLGRSFNAMMEAVRDRERDLWRLALFQRTILDNAAYAIISADPEGLLTSFNPAAERLLGYTADEVVAKQTPAIWHDPEEVAKRAMELSGVLGEAIVPGFEVFVARARRNLPDENEWTVIRKDGTRVPVLLSVTALRNERGEISGFVGLVNDLTERKRSEEALAKSEERFRRLAENARDVIYRMSLPHGTYEYMSPAAAELFGYSPEEFYASPQLVRKFMHPDWRGYLEEEWKKLLRGEMPPTYEFQIIHRSGEVRWMNQRNIMVRDEDGRPAAIEGIVTDVTERKKIEGELRNLTAQLEQRVKDRTAELEAKNRELERMNKVFVGRELRMAELKERIRELEGKSREGETDENPDS